MNTNRYPLLVTLLSIFASHGRLPGSKLKLRTVLPSLAALVCSFFLTVAPTRAQSVILPDITPQVISIGSNLVVYGRAQMIVPQGGKHVRQVAVYIPAQFNGTPSVTATVYSPQSREPCFRFTTSSSMNWGARRRWSSRRPTSRSARRRTTPLCAITW